MAESKIQNELARTFELEMPFASNMTEYLDQIIPNVRQWGEDLWEIEYYENKAWLEVSDSDNFNNVVLHFFNTGGEYLRSVEGNVGSGSWRHMEEANKLLLDYKGKTELYDLAFLNKDFFILKKHGNPDRVGQAKYFMMITESTGRRLEWRDAMELLFNNYRTNNRSFQYLLIIVLLVIVIVVMFSYF